LSQASFSFVEPVESAYPSIPSPSPAELMAKRIIESTPRKSPGRMPPGPRKKPGKRQAPRFFITRSVKEWICQTILAWPRPTIKWEEVREAAKKGYPDGEFNRQTLYGFKNVREAFNETKKRLAREKAERLKAGAAGASKPAADSDEFVQARVQFLEGRVTELEADNARLRNQFVRWQRNAFALAGLSIEQLDRPLLPIDRGRVDR
jgi:hypothetical protein